MAHPLIEHIQLNLTQRSTIILEEQKKEWSHLKNIQENLGLPNIANEDRFSIYEETALNTLATNEKKLIGLADEIRKAWRMQCFNATNDLSIAPEVAELNGKEVSIQNQRNILTSYEREVAALNSTPVKRHPEYHSFNTLYSSGMAAIYSVLLYALSRDSNNPRTLVSSIGYFETQKLVATLATATQTTIYKVQKDADRADVLQAIEESTVIFIEPTKSNYKIEDTDINSLIDCLQTRTNQSEKILILDISFNGNTFPLQRLLDQLANTNTAIIAVRSLSKMDQGGLELCNAGFAEFFWPLIQKNGETVAIDTITAAIAQDQNTQGSKLSFFEYKLLDNHITLVPSDQYASSLLLNSTIFYSQLSLDAKRSNRIFSNPSCPYLTFRPGDGDMIDNTYFNIILKAVTEALDISVSHKVNFGFRHAVIHNYQDAESQLYIFRINPGVFRGLHFWLYALLLDFVSTKQPYDLYELKRDLTPDEQ